MPMLHNAIAFLPKEEFSPYAHLALMRLANVKTNGSIGFTSGTSFSFASLNRRATVQQLTQEAKPILKRLGELVRVEHVIINDKSWNIATRIRREQLHPELLSGNTSFSLAYHPLLGIYPDNMKLSDIHEFDHVMANMVPLN